MRDSLVQNLFSHCGVHAVVLPQAPGPLESRQLGKGEVAEWWS
ncbi:hypothetical protein T261_8424 [Streptomyces lydicus]|nr:hypothetical protein T261_8424 [Streptomyces lydicus]